MPFIRRKPARLTDAEVITLPGRDEGEATLEVLLRPSARARRLSLRVSQLDGRVTLTAPRGMARDEALAFARDKAGWIRGHLARAPVEMRPMPGTELPFRGEMRALIAAPTRGVRLAPGRIELPQSRPELGPARLAGFLKEAAREALVEASDRHARTLGRPYGKITLRDTRSRWGSCSHEGNLMYSWRLIMAPPEVLDYVAAHEVAHLAHMDHSAAFWATVERLLPDHRPNRRWLRENGASLHRYRFRD